MKMRLQYLSLVAGVSLLAACGGSGDAPEPANDGAADTGAEATDTTAAASTEAPAADNVETVDGSVFADVTGDAAAGETVFTSNCASCHSVEAGRNMTGPSLAGLVGREAGSVDGYNYTEANANSGITWTQEKLFQYLEDPDRVIPGTKMAFPGLPDPQNRADVIAYLASTGA